MEVLAELALLALLARVGRSARVAAVGAVALAAIGCTGPTTTVLVSASDAPPTSAGSPTGCVEELSLTEAVDVVMEAAGNPAAANVFGVEGDRTSNLVDSLKRSDLAAMRNPLGEGVLVTVVVAGEGVFARSTASRTGWLVLDGVMYPLDPDAAIAFDRFKDVLPADIERATGTSDVHFSMDAYGLSDFVSYNSDPWNYERYTEFLAEATELCHAPTPWGSQR